MRTDVIHLSAQMTRPSGESARLWNQLRDDLTADGALRDIYVEDSSREQWQQFLDWLRSAPYPMEYHFGDQQLELPHDAEELFQQRTQPHLVRIDVGGVTLHCHCFCVEQIELDLNPNELTDVGRLDGLLQFLAQLAEAVSEDVILTHENAIEATFLVMHATRHLQDSDSQQISPKS